MALWIRNPLAVLANNAGGGIAVDGSRFVELVASGKTPRHPDTEVFDASEHVVLPGLINTHHHFFQTLCSAHELARDKELFLRLTTLYPHWSRVDRDMLRLGARLALAELLLSSCTTAMDHDYMV